jgi:hypothetical protein
MENGESPLLSAEDNKALYSAQFEDACSFLATAAWPGAGSTYGATDASCRAWSNSVMLAGINSVTAEYAAKLTLITDRRTRGRVFNYTGVGFIVDPAAYNYSDSCAPARASAWARASTRARACACPNRTLRRGPRRDAPRPARRDAPQPARCAASATSTRTSARPTTASTAS